MEEQAEARGIAGVDDTALYFESKQRILDLLRVFAQHGYVSLEEVASAIDRSTELITSTEIESLKHRIRELEAQVRTERLANDFASWDIEDARQALAGERDLVRESLVRIARLEGQLKDARRTTVKLIAASRNGLATLKRVRDRLATETYAAGTLTPLVHDFQELTQVVQELHALAIVKASTTPLQPQPR
jgi:hypothetical protein